MITYFKRLFSDSNNNTYFKEDLTYQEIMKDLSDLYQVPIGLLHEIYTPETVEKLLHTFTYMKDMKQ